MGNETEERCPSCLGRGKTPGGMSNGRIIEGKPCPLCRGKGAMLCRPLPDEEERGRPTATATETDEWLNEHAETIVEIINMTCTKERARREVAHYLRSVRNECRGGERATGTDEKRRILVGSPEHVALWNAIHKFGDTKHGMGHTSVAVQKVVVEVERALETLLAKEDQ